MTNKSSLVVFAVLLLAPPCLRAAPLTSKQVAAREYVAGKKLYDVGEYQKALDKFKSAYLAYEEPTFLFNMAQCYRQLGEKQDAIKTYRSYLRNTPDAPNRVDVNRIVAELETALQREREAAEERERAKQSPPQETLSPTATPTTTAAATLTAEPTAPPPRHNRHAWVWGVVGGVAAAGLAVGLGVGLTVGRPTESSLMKVSFP